MTTIMFSENGLWYIRNSRYDGVKETCITTIITIREMICRPNLLITLFVFLGNDIWQLFAIANNNGILSYTES